MKTIVIIALLALLATSGYRLLAYIFDWRIKRIRKNGEREFLERVALDWDIVPQPNETNEELRERIHFHVVPRGTLRSIDAVITPEEYSRRLGVRIDERARQFKEAFKS